MFLPIARRRLPFTFRHALLLSRPDETELKNWRPGAKGDLALQMVEWWAYLADILTFYNERIANQAYLRTADLPESLQRLIRILGYRPRPGIGASGTLAALIEQAKPPFTLPQGFPIQSKPGPGKQPQIFELDVDTPISFPDTVPVDIKPIPLPLNYPNAPATHAKSLLLKGSVSTVKVQDELLVMVNDWDATSQDYTLATVKDVQQEKDPRGKINTRVTFLHPLGLSQSAENYRLLKSVQSAHVWPYPTDPGVVILSVRWTGRWIWNRLHVRSRSATLFCFKLPMGRPTS